MGKVEEAVTSAGNRQHKFRIALQRVADGADILRPVRKRQSLRRVEVSGDLHPNVEADDAIGFISRFLAGDINTNTLEQIEQSQAAGCDADAERQARGQRGV